MTPYPPGSQWRSFWGKHPVLRELRNVVLSIIVGFAFLAVVAW